MKHKSNKKETSSVINDVVTAETIDQHFVDAAETLVTKMKTPAELLLFLSNALRWMHSYELEKDKYDENKDRHYEAVSFIEDLVIPWMNGGKEMMNNIASGFKHFYGMYGHERYYDTLGNLIAAYGTQFKDCVTHKEVEKKYMLGINTLMDCHYPLHDYELMGKSKAAS